MVGLHSIVGTLVLLAFLGLTVVNVLRLTGRTIARARPLSFAAAGLLMLQYVLGFSLLGDDRSITVWHYLIALSALITVGVEHGVAAAREGQAPRLGLATLATAATTVLVLVAYAIGESAG